MLQQPLIQKHRFYPADRNGAFFSQPCYACSSACRRSAMISSTYSMPTDSRIRSGPTPAASSCSSVSWRCVVLGVQHTGARVRHMGDDGGKLQMIHEAGCGFPAALYAEGDHAARAVRHIFLRERKTLVARKTRVVDPCDLFVLLQEFRHLLRIFTVPLHTQGRAFPARSPAGTHCVGRGWSRGRA